MTEKLSEKRLRKSSSIFRNPPPKSKTAETQAFGVDLSLLFRWLKLSPQERIEEARSRMVLFEEVKKQGEIARRK